MIKVVFAAAVLVFVGLPATSMSGQAPPAITYDAPSTGFSVPLSGQLTYAVSGGETMFFNYAGSQNGGTAYSTTAGATVGILTSSETHPFSLLYGGGVNIYAGSLGESMYYQSLSLSQQFVRQKWTFLVNESLRVTPDLPLGGVSGTAGVGDLGTGTAGGDSAGLLTPNQTRISESTQGSASRALTGTTSLNLGGGYSLLRSPGDGYAADSNSATGSAGMSHNFSARDSVTGTYTYQHTTQSSTGFLVDTHSGLGSFTHAFSATWTMSAGAGPQYYKASSSGISSSALSYSAQASLDHQFQFSSAGISFDREIRNAASYGASAQTTRAGVNFSRTFSPLLRASVSMSYLRTRSLPGFGSYTYSSDGYYVGAQVNRTISRLWSAYISYTLEDQDVAGTTGGLTPLQGFEHLVSFGVSFAPLPVTLHGH